MTESTLGNNIVTQIGIIVHDSESKARADDMTLKRARQMKAICDEYGVPLAATALQFSMRDPRIVSTIIGMTRPERLKQTLDLAQHSIPEEMWKGLEAVGNNTEDL